MCGIASVINGTKEEAHLMGRAIEHRGKELTYSEVGNIKVCFSHLPITTTECNQPIEYNGVTMWFNGYISNWKELVKEHSIEADNDTELLVKWIALDNDLLALNGFFAVLTYEDGRAYYLTDRYGIKQLYTHKQGNKTYICSEVKGIKAVCDLHVDEHSLNDWKYSLGVMTNNTIYKGIRKVEKLPFKKPEKRDITYDKAKEHLKRLLIQSVERNKHETLNDGVFLSGGIDSGILANYIDPVFCFSVDYLDDNISEIENIKRNSKGIHYTIICNKDLFEAAKGEMKEVIDDLKAGSCYTNLALTQLASTMCTVIYSGAGGDEVFGGFPHRNNKDIDDVVRRSNLTMQPSYFGRLTHDEYNWKFLEAVLIVEDRIGGNYAMETRYPLLDNDFVDFALSLPDEYLENKRILKDISGLNDEVLSGKKKGFSNPYFTNEEYINFMLNV